MTKKSITLLICITIFVLSNLYFINDITVAQSPTTTQHRVIVHLKVDFQPEGTLTIEEQDNQRQQIATAQETVLQALADTEITVIHQHRYIPSLALQVDEVGLAHLSTLPQVDYVEADTIVTFDDESLNQPSVGKVPRLAGHLPLIGVDTAWQQGYLGQGWAIAVLDTGVDTNHAFFQDKVIYEACFASVENATHCPNGQTQQIGQGAGVNCPLSVSQCDHGTHVAGVALGNGADFSGVAKESSLISVQVFSQRGTRLETSAIDQIAALNQIYELQVNETFNIAAVNISIASVGSHYETPCFDETRRPSIQNLKSVGVAVVIASGNSGKRDELSRPACIPEAISVGASTDQDKVANSSNIANYLTLLAPGESILSAVPENNYAKKSGTSIAAPFVSGSWALLKSKNPHATVDEITTVLSNTGRLILDRRDIIGNLGIVTPRIDLTKPALAQLTIHQNIDSGGRNLVCHQNKSCISTNPVEPGQRFTHTITVTNTGTISLSDVTIKANLSPGLLLLDGPIRTPTVALTIGQTISQTFTVKVADNAPGYTRLTAEYAGIGAETVGRVSATTVMTTLSRPDFAILRTASISKAFVGDTISYTYYLTNTGNVTMTNITLVDSALGEITLSQPHLGFNQSISQIVPYTLTYANLPTQQSDRLTATVSVLDGQVLTTSQDYPAVQVTAGYYLPVMTRQVYPFERPLAGSD